MKRGDEVFFFTLIDLFAQIMFFGLLLFVVQRAKEREELPVGFSDITELSDSLVRLRADAKTASALRDSIKALGGMQRIKGLTDSTAKLSALVRAQYGLPPCAGEERYIATAIVTNDAIELVGITATMDMLLRQFLNRDAAAVRRLSPDEFRTVFKPLTVAFPDCRFFVNLQRRNTLERPVLAVHSAFRSGLKRSPMP